MDKYTSLKHEMYYRMNRIVGKRPLNESQYIIRAALHDTWSLEGAIDNLKKLEVLIDNENTRTTRS